MIVADIMSIDPVTIGPAAALTEAATRMAERRVRRLPVISDGVVLGIITLGDLRAISDDAARSGPSVAAHMRTSVLHIAPDCTVEEAASRMLAEKVGALPVIAEGRLVGIITESDIFRCLVDMLGGRCGALQVTVADVAGTREKVGLLMRLPSLRTVRVDAQRNEMLLVFSTPRGLPDARHILEEMRAFSQLSIMRWRLTEPQEPRL